MADNLIRREQLGTTGHIDAQRIPSEIPVGYYKQIALDGISVIAAAVFGFAYLRYLVGGFSVWLLAVALLAFGCASGVQALVNGKTARRMYVLVAEVIAMSIFFYYIDSAYLAAAAILSFAFLAWGYFATRRELQYLTEIRFYSVTKEILGAVTTASLLFMILLYLPTASAGNLFVSEGSFSTFYGLTAKVAENFYPNIPFTGSLGDFAQSLATSELSSNPQFQSLTPAAQSSSVSMSAQQLVQSFSQSFGGSISSSDTLANVAYQFVTSAIAGWRNRFETAFLAGWTIVLFVVLRSIGIVFMWVNQLVLFVIYQILMASGFMKVTQGAATREKIEY